MAPAGFIAHQRGHRALEVMGKSAYGAVATAEGDGTCPPGSSLCPGRAVLLFIDSFDHRCLLMDSSGRLCLSSRPSLCCLSFLCTSVRSSLVRVATLRAAVQLLGPD